jgi:plastocyanin
MVVYLERLDGRGQGWTPNQVAMVRQRSDNSFTPFLVVTVGQTVQFPKKDEIYHRIFSYSQHNAFDLGVIRQGGSKAITFEHPGVVRFYCSLHPWEGGIIFVAPSPYFDILELPGTYEIQHVPPGRYRLRTWSETLPSVEKTVTIRGGSSTSIGISIDGRAGSE